MRLFKVILTVAALSYAALVPMSTKAANLFEIRAVGGGQDITVTASSLPRLIERAVGSRGEFAVFDDVAFVGTLRYAGVENALILEVDADGTTVRLTSPLTGLDRTFTGATSDDVEDQIADYLTDEAPGELARLHRELNQRSMIAVTDGNPHSSTARAAHHTYQQFSRGVATTREERETSKDYKGWFAFSLIPEISQIDAGDFSATSFSLPIGMNFRLSDRVGLVFSVPLNYTTVEGAQVFHAGVGLGLPIKVIKPSADSPWGWQVTPSGGAFGSGSYDMAAGGLLIQGAGSSLLSYDFQSFTVSMGNHISFYEGMEVAGYDAGVSQQILKNGLQISVPLGQRWLVDTYAIQTHFLQSAAVKDYFSVGGDFIYRFLGGADRDTYRRGYALIGGYADLGSGYTAGTIRAGLGWKF